MKTVRIQPIRVPASAHAVNSKSRVVFLRKQKPIGVNPFQEPINCHKVRFFNNDGEYSPLARWRSILNECRRQHCREVLRPSD